MGEREIKREVWSERGMAHTFLPLAFLILKAKNIHFGIQSLFHILCLSLFLLFSAPMGRKKPETKGSQLIINKYPI